MYWRLTSKEKPLKNKGEIKVIAAWQGETAEKNEYATGIYYANSDDFFDEDGLELFTPYCWSYIDELPCEERPDEPSEE